ncbi:hypothetical protein Psta_3408 [Pirellula staleyi DSM 6068]|uniref:Uncharacterized protein n=1 Tax=Pirellula staleyi (strain ATCC 27377 / DSM 6068 / ICPB 4128) TaxID=530564 RepID=D2QXZ5_PIRSD|nr:hypothetical protein [Pirellula staleyi]ADB18072.1 hypothetical protein Psta_3408 [Pirellula staleyi DSM 6068]
MPLTMNVGLNRKVGEANYGSRGASVNLEVELESSLVREPDQLREKIRYLFRLAKEAVEEELKGEAAPPATNGHANGNGHGSGRHQHPAKRRSATASQVRALHGIATRQAIDLASEVAARYGVKRADELSITEASELIDAFKPQTSDSGGGR